MKLTNKCKITIFGDSIPKGVVYENKQLKKLDRTAVDMIASHYAIEISNLSSYGQTLTRLVEKNMIEDYISSLDHNFKNIAVISIGGNDSDYNWKEVAMSPHIAHMPKTPPKDFKKLLSTIIKKLKSANVKVILTNIPPVCSKNYFDNVISTTADSAKVLEFLQGDIDNIYRHQELYNLIITDCAKENRCKLLDIRQHFLWDTKYLSSFCEDGIHPNKTGHEKIAQTIIEQLG